MRRLGLLILVVLGVVAVSACLLVALYILIWAVALQSS